MITLVSINGGPTWQQSIKAMQKSMERFSFAEALFITSPERCCKTEGIRCVPSITDKFARPFGGALQSDINYSHFILNYLHEFIETDFCLVVQPDSWVINPDAWTDEFCEYDYIGAPWEANYPGGLGAGFRGLPDWQRVGNGGFSLRSKKYLQACREVFNAVMTGSYEDKKFHPEDEYILRTYRNLLSSEIKVAPIELARKFSVENMPHTGQFGFHGPLAMQINGFTL